MVTAKRFRQFFKRRFALALGNKFPAALQIAAGDGGNNAIFGIGNRFPIFPADVGRAQKSNSQLFHNFATSRTRSKITSAISGAEPTAEEYQTNFPFFSVGFRHGGWPAAILCSTLRFASPSRTGISSCVCKPSLMKNGTTTIFFVCARE